jgi:acetylornithine deacetylase/succinyl-diaminopimelate desuccinylase-like protein
MTVGISPDRIAAILQPHLSQAAVRTLMVELAKVPSPQTALFEAEPLLRDFIKTAVAPRVGAMGFKDIRFDGMGNLIATYGANRSGASLMLCSNAMNQPQATMKNAYSGDVIDGRPHGLPGEAVMGKGLSEQKSTMAAMLHAMDCVIRSGVPLDGRLVFLCCVSGETGRHDAIQSVVETEGVRADICVLGGAGNQISLGNRGRIDVFITVTGVPSHSSRPHDGCNAITGAFEVHRRLLDDIKLTGTHPELGKQTLTINRVRSFPESTHTIQDRCELVVDRRLLAEDDPKVAFEQIEKVAMTVHGMKDPASGKPWSVSVKLGPFMYPSLVSKDSPVVKAITEASLAMTGAAPETVYNPNAFDQGYLNHVGIECCNYGPGEQKFAHTDLDMASVDRSFDAAKVFAFMIVRRLGGGHG